MCETNPKFSDGLMRHVQLVKSLGINTGEKILEHRAKIFGVFYIGIALSSAGYVMAVFDQIESSVNESHREQVGICTKLIENMTDEEVGELRGALNELCQDYPYLTADILNGNYSSNNSYKK